MGCARIEAPTGGAKDITPPKVVKAVPAENTTAFNNNNIKLTFSEFIALNNPQQEVIISPYIESPQFVLTNKTLQLKFKDTLVANTTYTIAFGEAIKDITEGNILKDYTYSFATGTIIDTGIIHGKLTDAYTQQAIKNAWVFVYNTIADTLIFKQKPLFIAKTSSDGLFTIKGLSNQAFRIFAVQDANMNMLLDSNENMAFLHTPIQPYFINPADTIKDTTDRTIQLKLFKPANSKQFVKSVKLLEEKCVQFIFNNPVQSISFNYKKITRADTIQTLIHYSNDTILAWFPNYPADTLDFTFTTNDSIQDSARIYLLKKTNRKGDDLLKLKVVATNISNLIHFDKPLSLQFNHPIKEIQYHQILLYEKKDTQYITIKTELKIN